MNTQTQLFANEQPAAQCLLTALLRFLLIVFSGSFGMGKNRDPRPHEAHLFSEIYTDETSQTGHDFLVIGGLMIPRPHVEQFEQSVIAARLPKLSLLRSSGKPREVKGSEFVKSDLQTYKRIVDVFFNFLGQPTSTKHRLVFHCSVVDCRVQGRNYSKGKKGQIGFNREIYYHYLSIARRYRESLFHAYPDYRTTNMTMEEMRLILQRTLRREDKRDWPYRRVQFRLSHEVQALQVSDILLGAVAYKLNGHYDSPTATKEKRELCDYIIGKAKAGVYCRKGDPKKKDWGQFRIWVREHRS